MLDRLEKTVDTFKLEIIDGKHKGLVFTLKRESEYVVGRDPGNEIRLGDHGVSRRHARFFLADDQWYVEDLGSTNGVLVKDARIEKTSLMAGDKVKIGAAVFLFLEASKSVRITDPAVKAVAIQKEEKTPVHDDKQEQEAPVKEKSPAVKPAKRTHEPVPEAADHADLESIARLSDAHDKILEQMSRVIVGQQSIITQILITLFSRGHCLMVGVPGLAKTLMVRTLAGVLNLDSKRIQFTPDLMPSDITGTDILEEDQTTGKRDFKFIKGPIFTNLLLADEINRTPPKTQAALLEAMQEYRVTTGGITYPLQQPFFVMATQNPLEQEGTYPLPEAQLDRFMFFIEIDYPTRDDEVEIILSTTTNLDVTLEQVLDGGDIIDLQESIRKIPVSRHVVTYAADLARATRPEDEKSPKFIKDWLSWGAGPRAGQYMILAAKSRAALNGRFNVTAEDVRASALPVLRHRIFCNFNASSEGIKPTDVVNRIIAEVQEPSAEDYR